MKVTNKERIERYDHTKERLNTMELAVHDLVNGKFSGEVRVNIRDYDPEWTGGFYGMRISHRGMPLFLVRYVVSAETDQVEVLTDQQIQDGHRDHPTSIYWRMVMNGRLQLIAKYGLEVAA